MIDFAPVMGIDPSLAGCALALALPKAPVLIERYRSKPAETVRERRERIRSIVDPIVELARQHQPKLVVIEGYAYGAGKGNQMGHLARAELRGVLNDRLLPHVGEIIEVNPASLKCFGADSGDADKAAMIAALNARYGTTFDPSSKADEDRADAFACMQLAFCCTGAVAPETYHQARVVRLVLGLPPLPKPKKNKSAPAAQGRLIA